MSSSNPVESLSALLAPAVEELGYDLEAVEVTTAGKRRIVRVAVDRDGGVTMDDIADVTRAVSRVLDDADPLGAQPYTLEVSSRGVDRPLTLPRHWRRNVGRLARVEVRDAKPLTGRILAADDERVRLEVTGRERTIDLADVTKAKIQVEFSKRPDPTAASDQD